MAIDSTGIESQIDSNLPDNTKRRNDASVVRFILKTVVRWVRDAANNNLSTWFKISDGTPGGANSDGVYRTGMTEFRGGSTFKTRTPNNTALGGVQFAEVQGLQVQGTNGGPAFMEFHLPGFRIDQVGVDTDGQLKYHPWGQSVAYQILIDTYTNSFRLGNAVLNRKIVLNQSANNDHQFYGFGINDGALRYQVDSIGASHVFYAGSSPATSVELARLTGSGRLGIGTNAPGAPLDIQKDNPTSGLIANFQNTHGLNGSLGALIQFHQTGVAVWQMGQPAGQDALVIYGWDAGKYPERLRINDAGNVGIGTPTPTAKLHLKSANGFDQLRLENRYTPSGPNDPNGQPGCVAWDDTWFYHKTTQGWRRMQLQSW
ncbi:hypothetical protein [Spirosoma oryzicola]|uniref:hypothetical protein n=1 Tax=Spirosoma oryzicola TaxID=2898794 RepID=UPI001E2F904A|nr:hypothetical protein [Spirosoma oryzicola]UHG93326.1 hypothetical protein LQ777_10580 [Spirosoma oryzicola]